MYWSQDIKGHRYAKNYGRVQQLLFTWQMKTEFEERCGSVEESVTTNSVSVTRLVMEWSLRSRQGLVLLWMHRRIWQWQLKPWYTCSISYIKVRRMWQLLRIWTKIWEQKKKEWATPKMNAKGYKTRVCLIHLTFSHRHSENIMRDVTNLKGMKIGGHNISNSG